MLSETEAAAADHVELKADVQDQVSTDAAGDSCKPDRQQRRVHGSILSMLC